MEIRTLVEEFMDWLGTLSPEFAFMLAVPFIVAAAALLQLALKQPPPDRRRRRLHWAQRRESGHRRWVKV